MHYVKLDLSWTDHVLAEDVIDSNGTLLLSKGHVLTEEDINALNDRNISYLVLEEINNIENPIFMNLYNNCLTAMEQVFQNVSHFQKIEQETLFEVFDKLLNEMMSSPNIIIQLRAIKDLDNYTFQHSLNVGALSALLARLNDYSEEDVIRIGHAGFLHDIGKALIPQSILQKPYSLTNEENEIIKRHPLLGYETLLKNNIEDEYILSAALLHHERLNGKGYPSKKTESNIPFVAQLVAVADVYDAISTDKSYKKSLSPFHAYMELQQLAFQGELNPIIVVKFLEYISKLIEGKDVLLNNGAIGTVIMATAYEPNRPLVEVKGEFIDLRKNRDLYIQEVLVN